MEDRIVGLMFVCNEDDILEQSVRHNIRFVDELFCIVDFKSVDNSRAILDSLKGEGLSLIISEGPVFHDADYRSSFVSSHPAFAYVFIDDDEFIVGVEPSVFKDSLRRLSPNSQMLMPWRTYTIDPDKAPNGFDPYIFEYRRKTESPQFYKAVYIRGKSQNVAQIGPGAHQIIGVETTYTFKELNLIHFPVRTFGKLLLKIVAHEMQVGLFVKGALSESFGYHIKSLFHSLQDGYGDKLGFVFKEGCCYAMSPQPSPFEGKSCVVRDPIDITNLKRYASSYEDELSLVTRMVVCGVYAFRRGSSITR